jgi:hypothetical protein
MKKDDVINVDIAGHRVAGGKVKEIDHEAGTVTIDVPATRVVMAFSTQLAPEVTAPPRQTQEHAILGTETDAPTSAVAPTEVSAPQAVRPTEESAAGEAAPTKDVPPTPAKDTAATPENSTAEITPPSNNDASADVSQSA